MLKVNLLVATNLYPYQNIWANLAMKRYCVLIFVAFVEEFNPVLHIYSF